LTILLSDTGELLTLPSFAQRNRYAVFMRGNGLLYSIKLNTDYDPAQPAISIKPDIVKYRYVSPSTADLELKTP